MKSAASVRFWLDPRNGLRRVCYRLLPEGEGMTLDELRTNAAPLAEQLEALARLAERDDFAPWICAALDRAAFFASLSSDALNEAGRELQAGV